MAIFEDVDISNFDKIRNEEFGKNNIVILKFGAEMCDACYALEGELEDLEEENENISVLIIDCNESADLAEAYDIARVPTMIIFKDKNTPIYRCEDVMLSQDIQKLIEEVC